jgi:hypothetical protein
MHGDFCRTDEKSTNDGGLSTKNKKFRSVEFRAALTCSKKYIMILKPPLN